MFGIFGKKKKRGITARTFVSAETKVTEISGRDMIRMDQGWKQDERGAWQPPDTVWASQRGEVYHRFYFCCGGAVKAKMMPEREAIRKGYRRCSRCDWDRKYQYL